MWFSFVFIFTLNLVSTLSEMELHSSATEKIDSNELPESSFFLDYIFKKYGNINGKISYEGFEHLLENLGLGVKFEKDHTLEEHKSEEGHFKEIHEVLQLHKHNHTEKRRIERSSGNIDDLFDDGITRKYSPKISKLMNKHCFTPEEMLVIYNLEPNHELGISPTNFLRMCPVIVYELDQKSCSFYQDDTDKRLRVKMDNIYFVWLSATVTVFVISLVGLLGVCMVPLLQKAFFNELLSFLVALAVGTLCGDSLLHLLPHAFKTENSEHDNIVVLRAGVVFLTVILFFLIENLLCKSRTNNKVSNKEDEPAEADITHKVDIQLQEKSMLHSHSHGPHTVPRSISSVAYMVIMGDGLHNLTDGLAIGAAFSGDVISGFSTAIAVFTHELPHELGDFAVLLQTGMTVSQAVYFNIISSILSFIGMVIGLLLGNFTSASQWIYAATAGAFLYIGLVNLMPEIKRPVGNGKAELFIQVAGIFCGGLIMLLIALFEHELENMFLQ